MLPSQATASATIIQFNFMLESFQDTNQLLSISSVFSFCYYIPKDLPHHPFHIALYTLLQKYPVKISYRYQLFLHHPREKKGIKAETVSFFFLLLFISYEIASHLDFTFVIMVVSY